MADNFMDLPGIRRAASSVTQYRAVKLDSTAFRVLPMTDANSETPIGILQDDPQATNEPCIVAILGVCRAMYGGSVTVGNPLRSDDGGKLINDAEVTDGTSVDVHHIAFALEDGDDDEVHYVYVHSPDRIGLKA